MSANGASAMHILKNTSKTHKLASFKDRPRKDRFERCEMTIMEFFSEAMCFNSNYLTKEEMNFLKDYNLSFLFDSKVT